MCMVDYSEDATLSTHEHRKAVKEHKCGDCGRIIAKGEKYHFAKFLCDGYWSSAKQCAHCRGAAQWLDVVCSGWLYGGIQEDLVEHWDEGINDPALLRLIVGIRRDWHKFKSDELMPIPNPRPRADLVA